MCSGRLLPDFSDQRVRNVFEVLYLLGQFFKICMLHLKNAYTPTSDQRAELQDLILNVHEKVQFGNNRGIHEYILEKVRWFSIARFRYNTVFKEMHAEKAIPIISRREQNHSRCCESVGTNLLKVSDRT